MFHHLSKLPNFVLHINFCHIPHLYAGQFDRWLGIQKGEGGTLGDRDESENSTGG